MIMCDYPSLSMIINPSLSTILHPFPILFPHFGEAHPSRPWSCSLVSPSPPSSPSEVGPAVASLLQPSDGELMDFVMYRAQNDANYPLENVNAGNLEGIMWYLQNEVLSGVYGPGDCEVLLLGEATAESHDYMSHVVNLYQ